MQKNIVALIGRPNVGKSTLFNRFSVQGKAIVHELAGMTRDRKYATANISSLSMAVVDTPGLVTHKSSTLELDMMKQTLVAINEAAVICFIIDAISSILPADENCADLIRKHSQQNKTILVVNKSEQQPVLDQSYYRLGFKEIICISARHGHGIEELEDAIHKVLLQQKDSSELSEHVDTSVTSNPKSQKDVISLAVVGRPNSGKSTFINALINEERLLTGPEAGVTRGAVEVDWKYKDKIVRLVDTAGLRKKSAITQSYELLSVGSTLRSIKFANIVLFMLDAVRGLEQQDVTIISHAIEEGRGIVLVVNKWDLVKDKQYFQEELEYMISRSLSEIKGIIPVYISAKEKYNLGAVVQACLLTYDHWNSRTTTAKLNKWLESALEVNPLPVPDNGKRIKIKYCTQIKTRPPSIKFFCNHIKFISESYKRYLLNSLKKNFRIVGGVPVRLIFCKTKNPYL